MLMQMTAEVGASPGPKAKNTHGNALFFVTEWAQNGVHGLKFDRVGANMRCASFFVSENIHRCSNIPASIETCMNVI